MSFSNFCGWEKTFSASPIGSCVGLKFRGSLRFVYAISRRYDRGLGLPAAIQGRFCFRLLSGPLVRMPSQLPYGGGLHKCYVSLHFGRPGCRGQWLAVVSNGWQNKALRGEKRFIHFPYRFTEDILMIHSLTCRRVRRDLLSRYFAREIFFQNMRACDGS